MAEVRTQKVFEDDLLKRQRHLQTSIDFLHQARRKCAYHAVDLVCKYGCQEQATNHRVLAEPGCLSFRGTDIKENEGGIIGWRKV